MTTETKPVPKALDRHSARQRLLDAANELFYEEGVHTVGIDKIIERAGVAKATLYNVFGSKDELIRAYLTGRHEARVERINRALECYESPRDRLLGVFDVLAELCADPGFRGCAFYNASAESPSGGAAEQVSDQTRAWSRSLFGDIARAAGAPDPDGLADQLVVLYDGAMLGARMDRNPAAAITARAVAAVVIDAAITRAAP